ncbi:MAG: hypothetical protein R2715_08980 [Ilumatobacteraceae bacterium]
MPLDTRRWFDRSQPQTLQIATFLLYFNGAFAVIDFLGQSGLEIGLARAVKGAVGLLVGLIVIGAHIGGPFLMANERKVGYYLSLVAAFSPFAIRLWVLSGFYSAFDRFTGGNLINFVFEAALVALLLHPQSRDHQRIWFH